MELALTNHREVPLGEGHGRLVVDTFRTRTDDGWLLELKRSFVPSRFDRRLHPLLIVPGYGMNSFIFGYHPRGTSMTKSLAEQGFEVWTVNLRMQDGTHATVPNAPEPTLAAYALRDVPAAIAAVIDATHAIPHRVVLVGCSMGGTLCYGYLAHHPDAPVHALVTMGTPLRWDVAHPAVRLAFSSPRLAGLVRIQGTRRMVRTALPLLSRVPFVLSPYLNAKHVDVSNPLELVRTVEDPHPGINRDLARWITGRDLVLEGKNLTDACRSLEHPLYVIAANADGIVPERAVLSVVDVWGGRDVEVLKVGDANSKFAHADLFIADGAKPRVFDPLAAWLTKRSL